MSITNFQHSTQDGDQVQAVLIKIKDKLEPRRAVWRKMTVEQRRAWVDSESDPIFYAAFRFYCWLEDNFRLSEVRNG